MITNDYRNPLFPNRADHQLYKESCEILAALLHDERVKQRIKVIEDNRSEQEVVLPYGALNLRVDILALMAQGNALTLMSIHAEWTTQEAADLLNVW